MTPTNTKRHISLVLTMEYNGTIDAGALRNMLDDVVELHPYDQAHLWGKPLGSDQVPPSANAHVTSTHVTLVWNSSDVEAYYADYDAEVTRRDAERAARTAAEAGSGASDSV